MHWGVCLGPVDAFRSIWFADKVAWAGTTAPQADGSSAVLYVDQPGLFGGDESEGGVFGNIELGHGQSNQNLAGVQSDGTYNLTELYNILGSTDTGIPGAPEWADFFNIRQSNLRPAVPDLAVNYRGMAVAAFHSFCIGNNAYLKEIAIEVERYLSDWYDAKAKVYVGDMLNAAGQMEAHYGMNAAHIIRDVYTNTTYGLGNSPDYINEESFITAADKLYDEGFGLSLLLADDQSAEDFIEGIKSTINATTYNDPVTDKFSLKLLRPGDPVVFTLNPDNFRLTKFDRRALSDTFNEVSARYVNPATEKYQSTTVHDLANIRAQGAVRQTQRMYEGIRDEAFAQRLAQRDLLVAAATLAGAEGVADQRAWRLVPGDVVLLSWPEIGIGSMRMRLVETTTPSHNNPEIRMRLTEDVFGQGQAQFTLPQEPGAPSDAQPPKVFDHLYFWELPYWYVIQAANVTVDSIPAEASYSTLLASDAIAGVARTALYDRAITPNGVQWRRNSVGPLTPLLRVSAAIVPQVSTNLVIDSAQSNRVRDVIPGAFILFTEQDRQELGQVTAVLPTGFTVSRGLMDTHPQSWSTAVKIYAIGVNTFSSDVYQRSTGEEVTYRAAMQTALGEYPVYDLTDQVGDLIGRFNTPYPPANIQIAGALWPTNVGTSAASPTVNVTWSTRNRLMQDSPVQVLWTDGPITPEPGSTVSVRVIQYGSEIGNMAAISGGSAAVALTGATSGPVTVEVWSTRSGVDSFMRFKHTFNLQIT